MPSFASRFPVACAAALTKPPIRQLGPHREASGPPSLLPVWRGFAFMDVENPRFSQTKTRGISLGIVTERETGFDTRKPPRTLLECGWTRDTFHAKRGVGSFLSVSDSCCGNICVGFLHTSGGSGFRGRTSTFLPHISSLGPISHRCFWSQHIGVNNGHPT
jgi:hypothetical protein